MSRTYSAFAYIEAGDAENFFDELHG